MRKSKDREIKLIFTGIVLLFAAFLITPVVRLLGKSFIGTEGFTLSFYREMLTKKGFLRALGNSFTVSSLSAALTTAIAFLVAYTIHYTNVNVKLKKVMRAVVQLPMFLPTITYGFAIIYSFGKEGLLTKIFGRQIFSIYGMNGLLLGYVIYTLPISFMLIYNAMSYIDKKYMIVSRVMGDKPFATFKITVLRPLLGTLAASFIQSFFLSFTDFGIPAAVGGKYEVVASILYDQMLGSVPNFNNGAVVAMVMLIPSVISITLLRYLEKYNVRYNKISNIEMQKNTGRDVLCGGASTLICLGILSIFLVIFIIPFIREWPYEIGFTLDNIKNVMQDSELLDVYGNSLYTAFFTALFGTFVAYGAALVTERSGISSKLKSVIEGIALVTNTIPGMVLGLAFLFVFSGTKVQGTFIIIVLCNVIHFFATPYLMMKESLAKMNASWETTAMLMGDNWFKTIVRIVTPNAISTIIEVFSYYFINAMVTISAVIFIAGARTMVITTKIKQLQYYNKYNEIFVLSLLLLFTNLISKSVFKYLANRKPKVEMAGEDARYVERKSVRIIKRVTAGVLAVVLVFSTVSLITGGRNQDQIVIYSNADDEAITVIKETLNKNGYEGKYILQSFGTSELGGKLLAEGNNIEADVITMSSFYLYSLKNQTAYSVPITAQEGSLILNTKVMEQTGLPIPKSLKDLANPVYKDMISVTDVSSSSTAWLMLQALVSAYGEDEAKEILTKIYENAGHHIEDSGSGPLKKVRAGEVAIGFGLRHQVVADKKAGLPIDYVDPIEGNFSLTESVAVLGKETPRKKLAMEIAHCIAKEGRRELQKIYPLPLYEGEKIDAAQKSAYPKVFKVPLTVKLLEKHKQLSEECK